MDSQELLYAVALTKLKGLSLLNARTLYETLGSASEVFAHRKDIVAVIPDASQRLRDALGQVDDALRLAEREMEFAEQKRLHVLTLADEAYPVRLKECEDAPLVLYGCGEVELNRPHVVSVVGTRRCSEYGREVCQQLVAELKRLCPDVLIVSGLAYGIDICAHRAALERGVDTVAVLAHGLDSIYPSMHRQTAVDMVRQGGGLLTEYTTQTQPERQNFVRRNRIVAGLCDACIVVESGARGGSLITAELASSYSRDVFAFPGRVHDEQSAGCNRLIAQHQATLLTGAEGLLEALGWAPPQQGKGSSGQGAARTEAVQQELFPDLNEEEKTLLKTLRGVDDKHINQMVVESNIPYSRASMLLFDLEMKGLVKALGGARFRLLHR